MSSERDPARRRADLAARWQRVNDMLADLAEGYTDPTASLDPTDALFQRQRITEFRMTIPPASWASLEASPREQVPASLAFEGAFYPVVGTRLKGGWGSSRATPSARSGSP